MKEIYSKNAPEPIGPYSQAIKSGDFVFCSGQIGLDPKTGEMVEGGIEEQTKQVLENLKGVLFESGFDFSSVVKTEIYLTNMNDFAKVNEIYGVEFPKKPAPARATVEVSGLPKGALVEISMIAELKK